ncbi:MAG: ribbon-helix-helix domain-containing protein [Devosia sp.]
MAGSSAPKAAGGVATKVVTAHLPEELAVRLDQFAAGAERSRGWVMRRALEDYLDWEDEKNRLTLEAIEHTETHGTIPHEEVVAYFEARFNGLNPEPPKPRKSE